VWLFGHDHAIEPLRRAGRRSGDGSATTLSRRLEIAHGASECEHIGWQGGGAKQEGQKTNELEGFHNKLPSQQPT